MFDYLDIIFNLVSVIIGGAISWFASYFVWRRQNRSNDLKISLSKIKSLSLAISQFGHKEKLSKAEAHRLLPKLNSCYLELFCIVPYFHSKSKHEIETMLDIVSDLEVLISDAFEDENEYEKAVKQFNDLLYKYLAVERKVLYALIKKNNK